MRISARVENGRGTHDVLLQTGDTVHSLVIPPKPSGVGSSANGGEPLFLALATCYCNDLYREAGKRGIRVARVEVEPCRAIMPSRAISSGDPGGSTPGQPRTTPSLEQKWLGPSIPGPSSATST